MRSASRNHDSRAVKRSAAGPAISRLLVGRNGTDASKAPKIKRRDLAFILRNLATLVGNGLVLPKSLGTLAQERTMRKYADMLRSLQRQVEKGESFSRALAEYPHTFSDVVVNQIRSGEKAGTLPEALRRVARQVENTNNIRSKVIRQLAYPAVLLTAGSLAVAFMLLVVIPVFEQTYEEAHVPLPAVTRLLMAVGRYAAAYGWILPVGAVAACFGIRRARRQPAFAVRMDRALLQMPFFGDWLRNMAVLQFILVFGNLMDSGFKLVDALDVSAGSIGNRALRESVRQLQAAVTRGAQFSRELAQMGELFPPVVNQLIAVGESTGSIPKVASQIREHLEDAVERKTNALVGTIEPILTITLAAAIAVILLAIYLPMFDMIGAVGSG